MLDEAMDLIQRAGRWPADLVGYSMGGRLALQYTARFPNHVRRLVLESASPGLEGAGERAARREGDEALAARIEDRGIPDFVSEWEAMPLFESQFRMEPALLARQRDIRLDNDARGLAGALRGLGTGVLPSLWPALPEVASPTLILVGELDEKFLAIGERMAELLPAAELVVVPDSGHCVHFERPDVWLDIVGGFLAET